MPCLLCCLYGVRLLKGGFCAEQIAKKVINQMAIAVFAFIICVTKVSLLVSRKVDPDDIKNS